MYQCVDCGNTEKFEGTASEKGTVEISKNHHGYDWSYKVSDSQWESHFEANLCYFCKSKKIIEI